MNHIDVINMEEMVDTVEVAIIPVLLGGGIPFLPTPARQTKLKLTGHRVYKTGIVLLEYSVDYSRARQAKTKTRARSRKAA